MELLSSDAYSARSPSLVDSSLIELALVQEIVARLTTLCLLYTLVVKITRKKNQGPIRKPGYTQGRLGPEAELFGNESRCAFGP